MPNTPTHTQVDLYTATLVTPEGITLWRLETQHFAWLEPMLQASGCPEIRRMRNDLGSREDGWAGAECITESGTVVVDVNRVPANWATI